MSLKSRKTRQKELIELELNNVEVFFTAEDLLQQIRKKDSAIGIATVYRFLKQKNDVEKLHSYSCSGKRIYSVEKRNHSHFICKRCNRTIHFNMSDIGVIKNSVKGDMCHFQLDIYGICENCKKQQEKSCCK